MQRSVLMNLDFIGIADAEETAAAGEGVRCGPSVMAALRKAG